MKILKPMWTIRNVEIISLVLVLNLHDSFALPSLEVLNGWRHHTQHENHTAARKHPRQHLQQTSQASNSHHKPALVALQADSSISRRSAGGAEERKAQLRVKERKARTAEKLERSYFSQLVKSLHQEAAQKRLHAHRVDMCNDNQYQWMVQIRQQCKDSYGDESDWDNDAGEGGCRQAWDECNSDFASVCCTQPEGPSSLDAYCSEHNGTAHDRACAVSEEVREVEELVGGIRDAVAVMDTSAPAPALPTIFQIKSGDCRLTDGGRCVVSPNWPRRYLNDQECEMEAPSRGVVYPRVKIVAREFDTEGCCDRLSVGDSVYGGEDIQDGPDDEVTDTAMSWTSDYSERANGWKVCAEDIPPPPPPPPRLPPCPELSPAPGPSPSAFLGAPSPAPFPCLPAGSIPPGGLAPAPAARERRPLSTWHKASLLEMQCRRLEDLVQSAGVHLDRIRSWASRDGIISEEEEQSTSRVRQGTSFLAMVLQATTSGQGTSEARDPDLTFAMRRVLRVGRQLEALRDAQYCNQFDAVDEDEDYSDDDGEAGASGGGGIGVVGGKKIRYKKVMKVNGTAIAAVLKWEGTMVRTVKEFETKVHPHGQKWWRYRYEYTLIESIVLCFNVMLLYWVMYLLHGVSFFGKFKFYNIGLTSRLFRYAWAYFVFHAASLMVMVTIAFMLYMPWGEYNIYDYCARAFHKAVNGRFNCPFLGYSWMLMILDVQFQLFACFSLYSLFIVFITNSFAKALDDWRHLCESPLDSKKRVPVNDYHNKEFMEIMARRVQKSTVMQRAFTELRITPPTPTGHTPRHQEGHTEFKLHLYLTDCFGKALEYLCEVSLKTILFLAGSALLVAILAHFYQVAFMYFLPIFLLIGILLFAVGYFIGTRLVDDTHGIPLSWTTVHAYCRKIQIAMYCVFFGFSRLLLSADIYTDYTRVYFAALMGLVLTILLSWLVIPGIVKATLCKINLPHDGDMDRFKKVMQNVAYWHTTENCHECGSRQAPPNLSISREWAGTKPSGDSGGPAGETSGRTFSFR